MTDGGISIIHEIRGSAHEKMEVRQKWLRCSIKVCAILLRDLPTQIFSFSCRDYAVRCGNRKTSDLSDDGK